MTLVAGVKVTRKEGGNTLVTVIRAFLTRLPWAVVTVWGVATIVFFLARAAGNPVTLLIPPGAPASEVRSLTASLGLSQSIFVQYLEFLRHAVVGNFGQSFFWKQDAVPLVFSRLPATFGLAFAAIGSAVVVAIPLGLAGAMRQGKLLDRLAGGFSTLCQSIPVFWLAPVLVLLFAVRYHFFPSSGKSGWQSWILPTASLALFQVGLYYRITRAAALEFLSQDAARLIRAKGATRVRLAVLHVVPNISAPLMTIIGLDLARLFGGSVIVETFFAWPGMGQLLIQAAQNNDYPVIQALVLVFSLSVVVINMVVEALYEAIDPRTRIEA
jgi:peptide/nickel transport system permease protein